MADASVKQDADEATEGASVPAEDPDATPAQAAGRRTRKPVQPPGGVVTRRTSARQVASSATRATCEAPRQTRGRQAALRRKAPSPVASPAETPQHRKGWKRKKSDPEDLSPSEPELEHDDSDSDPVWIPDAAKGAAGAGVAAPPPAPAATEPEPEAKPVRRGKGGKPAKTKPARPGARKGGAKKPNGKGGGSIDLAPDSGSPESLQLKVELPTEGDPAAVRRDYTRRPGAAPTGKAEAAPLEIKADGGGFKVSERPPGRTSCLESLRRLVKAFCSYRWHAVFEVALELHLARGFALFARFREQKWSFATWEAFRAEKERIR
ncbi:conserved hypothetical protein [Ixodes scapularis]|uniref:Uncharacterized protein n=1 Tax=Ixodes scapularis TaxID=6945 RepID=B7PBC9_IXOSC|nr:conserved hypothetical protein [Ixodes scapularis]|eukprot:XP_002407946.1 conserved hypothetical protein [Ixodes scapularis]